MAKEYATRPGGEARSAQAGAYAGPAAAHIIGLMRLAPLAALALLAAAAFAPTAAFGADPAPPPAAPFGSPVFSALGVAQGLPNASVSSIVQDGRGFLWFGTQGGLARYDGRSFKLFSHEPFDPSSLPSDIVQTLYLDGEALWVGTYGGLARFDLRSERFASYRNAPQRSDSLSDDVVTAICRDAAGSLWVGTLRGLNVLDEAKGTFRRFLHEDGVAGSIPSSVVRALKVDGRGRLWIGTAGGGLARYDYGSGLFAVHRGPWSNVMAIAQGPGEKLWLGCWDGGLSLFDPRTGSFENHPAPDARAYALSAAEDGAVFVGTWGGGLLEYDVAKGSYVAYRASLESGSLSHDVVYSLFRDSAGELWIGTNGGGLCKLDRSRRGLEAVSSGSDGLPEGKVCALLVDGRGCLWAGVYNRGLFRRDPASGSWRAYRHAKGDPASLPADTVDFLFEDSGGALWVGTHDGLARYDRGSDTFSSVRPRAAGEEPGTPAPVFEMAQDPSGGFWLGLHGRGLYYWDRKARGGDAFFRYAHEAESPESLSNDLVTAVQLDGSGRLWVGTNRGLNLLEGYPSLSWNPKGRAKFRRYLYDPAAQSGPSSDSIAAIFLDSRKLLWIGSSGGGLMRYESATDSFVRYTKRDGLPSNTVVRILEDGSGNLWVATQAGLALYDRALGRIRSISVYAGAGNPEFFSGTSGATDGSLFFGATDRIYRFDPARYQYNDHLPPLAFTSISVDGGPSRDAGTMAELGERKGGLELSWKERSIAFGFAALDFRDSAANRYSWKLEGYDSAWSKPSDSGSASYANLPPGSYVFRVKASNNDGLWNEVGIALPVRVRAAPWSTPAAHLLYGFLLALGGYLLAHFISRTALFAARAEADGLRARLVEASASMEMAAIVDGLTGLPNRRKAEEHLELAFSRAVARKLELAVLLVDIDRFKAYNDRFGRAAGDECLRRVASALASFAEASGGIVARYGGEEFLVVIEEAGLEEALEAGEGLRKAVEDQGISFAPEGSREGREFLTVSVGCAAAGPYQGQSSSFLLAWAERALMAAKMKGRDRVSS